MFWHAREHQLRLLEGGETLRVELPVTAEVPGDYTVRGVLEARDLEERPYRFPFVVRLSVAVRGRRYQVCPIQPYEIGSGLGSDRTFVGRGDLIEWLATQWRSPDTRQGVVLVGQRRIGKTSLLNYLERHGLPQTPLVAVKADLQASNDEYQFLDRAAARIAGRLDLPAVVLDQSAPYRAFERFLDSTVPALAGRRILLMVDEANLLPQRFNATHLPGFLRSLMQGDFPLVVMFCGTHALREGARDYDSILFNTARFRTISYLTEAEAEEVLERPARDYLEFDESTLRRGYALTHGQPLLLQTLGALTIEDFNAEVRQGRARSTFVSPADLDRAAEQLVRAETSPVFDEHWEHASLDTRLHLCALAWATDEDNRRRLDAPGLRNAMKDAGLQAGAASATSAILDSLTAEQVLVEEGPTYRYAVPLYRRWIAWRHPPRKLRVAQGE
ncbi:MAG: ATP-binding protein [Sulfuricellaceae bacterium]